MAGQGDQRVKRRVRLAQRPRQEGHDFSMPLLVAQVARRGTMRLRCMDPLSSASGSGGRGRTTRPGLNLDRFGFVGHREVVPRGRLPETEPRASSNSRRSRRVTASHIWGWRAAHISASTKCMVLQPHASPGKGPTACCSRWNSVKFVQEAEQLDGGTVSSPGWTAGALKNTSLDQFQRCSKSFFTMHPSTLGPHDLQFLPAGWLCSEMGFEQVRHRRVRGLRDPGPSKCQGGVPMDVCDGL